MRTEKFDFDDILLEPADSSYVLSRKKLIIKDGSDQLPLFTAPMDTVINWDNSYQFILNGITSIIPRTSDRSDITKNNRNQWFAYSMTEFEKLFLKDDTYVSKQLDTEKIYALIDIANGHIKHLEEVVKMSKDKYGDRVVLMVGNIANPITYGKLSDAGADYIRIGIGNGCFIPDMEVKTNKGLISIKNINIGDKVYTHTGELKEVINKLNYYKDEETIKINGIHSTLNHEYYVIEKQYENLVSDENIHDYAKWIRADELDKDKHLLVEL